MKPKTKITKQDLLTIERAARRIAEIELGTRSCPLRVHRSKKTYSRKHKNKFAEHE